MSTSPLHHTLLDQFLIHTRRRLALTHPKSQQELENAAILGWVRQAHDMLPNVDPSFGNHRALWFAAHHGHTDVVRLLVQYCTSSADRCAAMVTAATNGHTDCVRVLMSDPKYNNEALMQAATRGHLECVNLLIPVSDACANNSMALAKAVEHNHIACVNALYAVSDPQAALDTLLNTYLPEVSMDYPPWYIDFENRVLAERQRQVLADVVHERQSKRPRKM